MTELSSHHMVFRWDMMSFIAELIHRLNFIISFDRFLLFREHTSFINWAIDLTIIHHIGFDVSWLRTIFGGFDPDSQLRFIKVTLLMRCRNHRLIVFVRRVWSIQTYFSFRLCHISFNARLKESVTKISWFHQSLEFPFICFKLVNMLGVNVWISCIRKNEVWVRMVMTNYRRISLIREYLDSSISRTWFECRCELFLPQLK